MDVIKKWAGWLLALVAAMFIIASCQQGAFDEWTGKIPRCSISEGCK